MAYPLAGHLSFSLTTCLRRLASDSRKVLRAHRSLIAERKGLWNNVFEREETEQAMIDEKGYRFNVGIILANSDRKLFWARRIGQPNAWQFPQGGISANETLEEAMYRELKEELGLGHKDVEVLAMSTRWLYYHLPKNYRRYNSKPLCIGQKQKWFLLRFIGNEQDIRFDTTDSPEFDKWDWVDYWHPVDHVIPFKRLVYKAALKEFESLLFEEG